MTKPTIDEDLLRLEQGGGDEPCDDTCTEDNCVVKRIRAALAERDRSSRQPIIPRQTVGQFRPQLTARPVLLEVDDAALAQLRDFVAAFGNWYDFAAFNAIVLEAERARIGGK